MGLADTANLIVKLSLAGNFTRDIDKANRSLGNLVKGESRAFKAGAQIGTGIRNAAKIAAVGVGILTTQVVAGLDSLIKLESATAQTEAVIKSTGGAAGVTAGQVRTLAEKFESLNAQVGDEFIQAGENMLLTFTRVRGKAFEPALAAILDLNTALGKGPEGLTNTALQVGKALQDPEHGLLALRRAGVSFTTEQVKRIKALQKEGKLYEAQKIILGELNKEFGGSFAKAGTTTAGKVAKFTDSIEDLQRALATALLPTLGNVADGLSKFLSDPAVIQGAKDLGDELGKLFSKDNLKTAAGAIGDAFAVIKTSLPAVKAGLSGVATVVGGAVKAFQSLPPEIQALAVAGFGVNKLTGGLVTNIGGGLISAVLGRLKSAVVNVEGAVVNVNGGVGGAAGAAGKGGVVGTGLKVLTGVVAIGAVAAIADAIHEEIKAGPDIPASQLSWPWGPKNTPKILPELAALFGGKNGILGGTSDSGPATSHGISPGGRGGKRTADRSADAIEKLKAAIVPALATRLPAKLDTVSSGIVSAGAAAKEAGQTTKTAVAAGAAAQGALIGVQTFATLSSAFGTQNAVRSTAGQIVSGFARNRPIVNVAVNVTATQVTKSVTIQNRYGPGGGSAAQNIRQGAD